jgi:signal transduction histidine kinase
MIELPLISIDLVRTMVENFAIIAMLVLLYIFIPESFRSQSKLRYSAGVGIIFGLAAAIGIPALWIDGSAQVIGFNIILVPLAGFIAGPVSTVFVAGVLLLGSYVSTGFLSFQDILTVMLGVLLGSLLYAGKSRNWFSPVTLVQLAILGAGVALIEISVVAFSSVVQSTSGPITGAPPLIEFLPFLAVSWVGTVLIGSIIGFIDRKKQAEKELLDYSDHLEGLVKDRTAELRLANSLQRATIESTGDAIVVVDPNGMIRAYNQKASHILDLPRQLPGLGELEGAGIFATITKARLVDPEGFCQTLAAVPESAEQIVSTNLEFMNGRIYELFVQPQYIADRIIGRVFSFHDITEQRHAEDAIRITNNKLVLLSNITRHDILNQITALSMNLELARKKIQGSAGSANLDSMEKTLEVIRLQLEFTRDYQDLGLQKPVWQNVNRTFVTASESFASRNITFTCETGDLEIYSDPLIERVFYNLIDNSIRHGERISEIRLSVERAEPDLVLVYTDNGIGIPPDEKERIFQKGFGKHTGLGMFLIREILSITGMTIQETGEYELGVRFEIHIPPGKFRITS